MRWELKPLPEALPEQQRALAQQLRALFGGLGVSVTRYSARVHLDKSVVSRYLSGTRVPPWAFVRGLLVHATQERDQTPPTVAVVSHLKNLHRAALEAGNATYHTLLLLQDQLAEADQDVQLAKLRERNLEMALQTAHQRIADMAVRERELQAALETTYDNSAALEELNAHGEDGDRLRGEIARLEHELEAARRRHTQAEQRCMELERRLEAVQRTPDRVGMDLRMTVDSLAVLSPRQAAAELEEMDRDWGAVVLRRMDPLHAAATLAHVAPIASANLLGRMMSREALPIVSRLQPTQVLALAEYMDPRWAAAVARQMDTRTVAMLLNLLPAVRTATVLGQMPLPEITTFLDLMEPTKKAAVLELVHHQAATPTAHPPSNLTGDKDER